MRNSVKKIKATKVRRLFLLTMVFTLLFSMNAFASSERGNGTASYDLDFWAWGYPIHTSSTIDFTYDYDGDARVGDLVEGECSLNLTLGSDHYMYFNDVIVGLNRPLDFPEYNGGSVTWNLTFYYNDGYSNFETTIRVMGYIDEWGQLSVYTEFVI